MTNLIVWLIAGAGVGLLAARIIHERSRWSLLIYISAGIVGAVLTGYLATPMFRYGGFSQGVFSILGLLVSLAGAIILLGVVYLWRRKRTVNSQSLEANWTKARDKVHVRWDRLSEEDVAQIDGKHEKFIILLQERYGYDREKAEEDLQNYLRAVV